MKNSAKRNRNERFMNCKNESKLVIFTLFTSVLGETKHGLLSLVVALCRGNYSRGVGSVEVRLASGNVFRIEATLKRP